jgi:hypothetical protein
MHEARSLEVMPVTMSNKRATLLLLEIAVNLRLRKVSLSTLL